MGASFSKKQLGINYNEDKTVRILQQEHFRILEEKIQHSSSILMLPENFGKSGYWLLPCLDHNRVILPTEYEESDYINANRVNGYNTIGKYLCCQGPLQSTAEDFWKMVFADQSRVIVMLTKTQEENEEACYQYWSPKKGKIVSYGNFTIKTKKVKTFWDHVVSNLQVTDNSNDTLDITHFAYTDWGHNNLPRSRSDFLKFVLEVREAQKHAQFDHKSTNYPPIVVHCPAGLNHSGAFCALDISISKFNESATIDLATAVINLRKQRNGWLFSSQYYIFCYLTLLEYVQLADKQL